MGNMETWELAAEWYFRRAAKHLKLNVPTSQSQPVQGSSDPESEIQNWSGQTSLSLETMTLH